MDIGEILEHVRLALENELILLNTGLADLGNQYLELNADNSDQTLEWHRIVGGIVWVVAIRDIFKEILADLEELRAEEDNPVVRRAPFN